MQPLIRQQGCHMFMYDTILFGNYVIVVKSCQWIHQ